MAHILIMPRQGNSVESCVLVAWKVAEGAVVTPETPVCDVETDKATFEVLAGAAGTVLKTLCAAGDDVPVLKPIAVIGAPGENWAGAVAGVATAEPLTDAKPDTTSAASVPPVHSDAATPVAAVAAAVGVSPRARKLAARSSLDASELAGSGPGGRIIERDVQAAAAERTPLTAAARAAVAVGATRPAVGSGFGGRATLADVAGSTRTEADFPGPVTEIPIKGIRKLIAARMLDSLATTAQFTLSATTDATRLQSLRGRFKALPEDSALQAVTINDLLLYAVARVLPRFGYMNAHKDGDTLRTFERVHLGVAVDTPRGLMVPVVRNADRLSLEGIATEVRRLGEACRNNTVKAAELSGSTFTVTNLGALGVESFTPVLNVPEVAILGVCGMVPRPILEGEGGAVRFAPHLGLSLTINHQVVDGAPAARFLMALREAIADIDLLLIK